MAQICFESVLSTMAVFCAECTSNPVHLSCMKDYSKIKKCSETACIVCKREGLKVFERRLASKCKFEGDGSAVNLDD